MTVVQAEWSVLLRRWSARATLALSVLLPLLVLGIFRALGAEDAALQFNGKPVSEIVDLTAANAATAALGVRNAIVMPVLFLLLAGQVMAGERSSHVLREHLVRPIGRGRVLWGKVAAVWGLGAIGLGLHAVVTLGIGSLVLDTGDGWRSVLAGHAASMGSDLALVVFGFFLACHLKSAVGVLAVGLGMMGVDWVLRIGLSGLRFVGVESAEWVLPIMPGTGLGWYDIDGASVAVPALAGLCVWVGAMAAMAHRRIHRMDVH
ncbi:MAG: ABC transporter permease [Myxococcota bacterium]|nr:ABC transporter permease [Myxococcota bacterium]